MEIKTARANFDYERQLFADTPAAEGKENRELEYLMFYDTNYSKFYSTEKYSEEFLSHVESIRHKKFELIPNTANYEFWWGKLQDKELERMLNSKIFCKELCNITGLYHPGHIRTIEETLELGNKLSEVPIFIRQDGTYSGKGLKVFRRSIEKADLDYLRTLPAQKILTGHWYEERLFDFGIWQSGSQTKVWLNKVNSKGTFSSSLFCPDLNSYREILGDYFSYLPMAIDMTKEFRKCLFQKYGANDFKLDGFVYRFKDRIGIVPVIEVNFRKTMGQVNFMLSSLAKPKRFYELSMTKDFGYFPKDQEVIRLTPIAGQYQFGIFHAATDSTKHLQSYLK
jgi:hypothetical protein